MYPFIVILSVLTLVITQGPSHGKVVVCPVMSQTLLDAFGTGFIIENTNWSLCTHIILTETLSDEMGNTIKPGKYQIDVIPKKKKNSTQLNRTINRSSEIQSDNPRNYQLPTSLKAKFPHLKVIYTKKSIAIVFQDMVKI